MTAISVTAAGAVAVTAPPATRPPAAPTTAYSPPSPPAPRPAPRYDPTVVAPPPRRAAPVAPGSQRASRPGLVAVIVAAAGLAALIAAGGLYLYFRGPATTPAPGAPSAENAAALRPAAAPETVPPRAESVEREAIEAPPITTAPARAPTHAPPPSFAPPTRPAAAPVPAPVAAPVSTTAAAPAPAPPSTVGTLRLDVSAVQPSFGDMASSLVIDVRVDGQPLRSVSLHFEGSTPFARSRRRQAFDIPGVPVGQHTVSVVVRADRGLDPVQAETRIAVAEGTQSATLDVRLRGNGDGDATFR